MMVDRAGLLAEAGDGLVVPNLGFDAGIGAGLEKHCIAIGAELRIGGQRREGRIDRRYRIAGSKDVDVWAENRAVLCGGPIQPQEKATKRKAEQREPCQDRSGSADSNPNRSSSGCDSDRFSFEIQAGNGPYARRGGAFNSTV